LLIPFDLLSLRLDHRAGIHVDRWQLLVFAHRDPPCSIADREPREKIARERRDDSAGAKVIGKENAELLRLSPALILRDRWFEFFVPVGIGDSRTR
jgi:hypothetical protein